MDTLNHFFIGRQPIFDSDINLYAYALLFRHSGEDNFAQIDNADQASAQLIINVLGDIGLAALAGEHKVFINLTDTLLIQEGEPFFNPRQVIIELLEHQVTPALIRTLKDLRHRGFKIALDDHQFTPEMRILEDYADIIKIDIQKNDLAALKPTLDALKARGIQLLAEKVETYDEVKYCDLLGFDYFQGYFFAKPQIIQGQTLPPNKLSILQLLSKIYQPNIQLTDLSKIITHDVVLSQKLLSFIRQNIPSKYPITSIHNAVMRCGLEHLRNWVGLMALSNMSDKPNELFYLALTRARFCELISEYIQDPPKERYFTVGLFSTLDAIMDRPLEEILQQLGLDDDHIIQALLEQANSPLTLTLKAVKALERGQLDFECPKNMPLNAMSQRYLDAIQYAQNAFKEG
ncbi:MAG: EAL domain-containing protein [Thiomicrospira sp.]|nr:EAL domain-containing protein [Thiomicrospira sp.]